MVELTKEETSALKAVAGALSTKCTEAGLAEHDLTLWVVDLSALPNEVESLTESQKVVLLKFLRARKWAVDQALSMLVECLKWRRDFGMKELMDEELPSELTGAGVLYGRDRSGNPITWNFYGGLDVERIFGTGDGVDRFVRWRVQLMERAVAMLEFDKGIERVMQVHDYSGANMLKASPTVKAASRRIIKLFQDNYPEMLSAKLFLHVPRVMEFVFGVISVFSDPATRKRFQMIGAGRARAALLELVSPDNLPARYGGFEAAPAEEAAAGGAADSQQHQQAAEVHDVTIKPGSPHEVMVAVAAAPACVHWKYVAAQDQVCVSTSFTPQAGEGQAAEPQQAKTVTEEFGGGSMQVSAPGTFKMVLANPNTGYLWVNDVQVSYTTAVVQGGEAEAADA